MFPPENLAAAAFRTRGGESAWRRPDALELITVATRSDVAILGGEVWLVLDGKVHGMVPQKDGPPAVEHWECKRCEGEAWTSYVLRAGSEAREAIKSLPDPASAALPGGAEIYYNVVWVEAE